MTSAARPAFDYVLVGGGLGNALIALAVLSKRPTARVALVEQRAALGGNHVWCFHAGDVDDEAHAFVSKLVIARWPRYDVFFPELSRTVEDPYAAVRSERLHEVVQSAFERHSGSRLLLGQQAVEVGARHVVLQSGQTLQAEVVIESRGPEAFEHDASAGYQKFVGLELKLKEPCPIAHPLLMDARLSQQDGFRFMYALPFARDRVLLEDTYFSRSKVLNRALLEEEILAYAEQHGFVVDHVARSEMGILPLPTRFTPTPKPPHDGPLIAGYQGGWFHPVTGYSFPIAARVARAVADADPAQLREVVWPALLRRQRAQLRFCLFLNRLFFGAFAPEQRRNVIERFYKLPPDAIRRFYAMTLTHRDRARILCGRPPRGFSMARALSRNSTEGASP